MTYRLTVRVSIGLPLQENRYPGLATAIVTVTDRKRDEGVYAVGVILSATPAPVPAAD